MNLIDTHAHLFWDSFKEDFEQIIQRCLKNEVTTLINVGVDLDSSRKALTQVENKLSKFQELTSYCAIGIHPHEAFRFASLAQGKRSAEEAIQQEVKNLEALYHKNPQKVVAIGECGLDFFFRNETSHAHDNKNPAQTKQLQINLLAAQIKLAKKLNLPLLIHCRDDRSNDPKSSEAWDRIADLTKNYFGIYHCFSGLPPTTKYLLLDTNFYFSFAANITYTNAKILHETVKEIPLDRILTETDCPFLPPQEKRGQRNEPANVFEVVKKIAEIKALPVDKIASQIQINAQRLLAKH